MRRAQWRNSRSGCVEDRAKVLGSADTKTTPNLGEEFLAKRCSGRMQHLDVAI